MNSKAIGEEIYKWAEDLFPINRSLSGEGTRETLKYLKNLMPELKIQEIKSGEKVFDWEVPNEWNIKEAWVKDESGEKIINFSDSNLHIMGYSEPVHKFMNLQDLQKHLYSLPDQPDAIPYITSYYKRRWGFCLTEVNRKKLKEGKYEVFIDSTLEPGVLNYGELLLPGESSEEVLLSTYVCHPSMANNELSGPLVTTAIVRWLKSFANRKKSYRVVFLPETIGSLIYLSKNLPIMKKNVIAGFVLTCIGDNLSYSMLESRSANSLADRVAKHVLSYHTSEHVEYSFLERGSDERQYCAPGVDLPVCDLMRSKYGKYNEYHTSLDNLDFISPEGLSGGFDVVKKCLEVLEKNNTYKTLVLGEPQLGKRGLYPTISTKNADLEVRKMMNLIAYSDGTRDLLEVAVLIGENIHDLFEIVERLQREGVLDIVNKTS